MPDKNNMTLREEIKNIISSEVAWTDSESIDGEEEAAIKILKLFEKRIDSMYFDFDSMEFTRGYESALDEIKEMLK